MRLLVTISICFLFLSACKKDSFLDASDFGYNYQPQDLGHWVSYRVDSIVYNDVTTPPTITEVNYFIREELDTTFEDAAGLMNIRIIEYKKYNDADPWFVNKVGTFQLNNGDFQRNFNDLRFVNLVFPIRSDKEWQGNIYLDVISEPTLEYLDDTKYDWSYHYSEIDVVKQIGSFSLDSCLTVVQIDEENLFEKKYSTETYARNIGMVGKEVIILNTQAPPSGASFLDRAETGFILRYTLKDYNP